MSDQIFSVAIPYRQRLENIRGAFTSLAEQTLDYSRFEVVVGAIDYCPEYVALCKEFSERLTIITVMAEGPWNYSRVRNLAIRQADGEILVVMDADMMLPADFQGSGTPGPLRSVTSTRTRRGWRPRPGARPGRRG